ERRVYSRIHDLHFHSVTLLDRLPIGHARTAQRIDTDLQPGISDDVDVHDRCEIVDVWSEVVVTMRRRGAPCSLIRDSDDACEIFGQEPIRFALDPPSGSGLRRPSVRRVVLESPVLWRIMGRGDDNTVGKAGSPSPVVGQDRVRHHWSRSKGVTEADEGVYAVTGEHL